MGVHIKDYKNGPQLRNYEVWNLCFYKKMGVKTIDITKLYDYEYIPRIKFLSNQDHGLCVKYGINWYTV